MEGSCQGVLREHVSQENETDCRVRSLVPDPLKFPRGMRYIADQLHSMGLQVRVAAQLARACVCAHVCAA